MRSVLAEALDASHNQRMDVLVVVYEWQVRDKVTGRWRNLSWKMDELSAAAWAVREGVEIRPVEGSREERHDLDGRRRG